MTPPTLLTSTLKSVRQRRSADGWSVPGLTVLFHPDPARVGDVARLVDLLHGRAAGLSRLQPDFAPPGASRGAPLAEPHVSRSALTLAPDGQGGVVLRADGRGVAAVVDGTPLAGARTCSRAELERGLTLELAEHVVLLLHLLGPPTVHRTPPLGMVGESELLEGVRQEILRVADLEVTVLIRGESGTGKELAARAIAASGPRARGPFVSVNLAAVPTGLAPSELFGHVAGAYTGAARPHAGRFAQAHGGTLFLDEVAQAPLDVQAMLLRVLETKEVEPLGAERPERVDVRVLAATDEDLEAAISSGRFREPLYHRLTGYQLALPPLRERRDDIGRLFFHFLREELAAVGEEHRFAELGRSDPWLPAAIVAELARHDWPGNVRQLANAVRRLVVASRGGVRLTSAALPRLLQPRTPAPVPPAAAPGAPAPPVDRAPPAAIRDEVLLEALRANRWHVAATARQLRISRTSLYARMDASPRIRKASEIPEGELRRAAAECDGDADAMAERLEVSSQGLRRRLKELGLA